MIKEIILSDEFVIINDKKINLIKYIEENDYNIRYKYLSLIENLNKSINLKNNYLYNGVNLSNYFKSFEKNPYKIEFKSILKLIAINEILQSYDVKIIVNKIINKKFRLATDIITKNIGVKKNQYFFKKLLNFFKSSLFLFYQFGFKKKINFNSNNLIFTYATFNKEGYPVHWNKLKKYYGSNLRYICFPTSITNMYLNKKNKHIGIYEIISNSILLKSYLDYLFMFIKNFNFNFYRSKINIENAIVSILYSNFIKDITSITLLENIIYVNFFKNFFDKNLKNKNIFYIYENYSWQKIIQDISSLKKYNKCFAFQHSSVRFWDTRYFSINKNLYPKNYLISNIEYFQYLRKNNIKNIIQVENLRLDKWDRFQTNVKKNKILIFFDHDKVNNENLLDLIRNAFSNKMHEIHIKLNHIDSKANYYNLPSSYSIISSDKTFNIYEYNFYIVVNASGVSEDLLVNGVIPFIFVPKYDINLSPLRNKLNSFFSNENELLILINNQVKKINIKNKNHLGDNINLWNYVLNA